MKDKILIVDDEKMIINLLKDHFETENYIVFTALSAKEAIEKLSLKPHIIILDINMPDMDGITLCSKIRNHVYCPIIFLSARIEEQDIINGLRVGGDDYIVKPFSIDELTARVESHLRREQRRTCSTDTRFSGGLAIDYSERIISYEGKEICVSRREFDIIKLLSMNAGIVFEKETIYEKIWGYDAEGDSSVIKEHIRKIRMKLSRVTGIDYIETVWGVGYRWNK
ncbi:response regulator transcription factor [Clostridium oryzae]|uniref:Stage 0 sporulation protein A homolog n=1 Tax=Clostridium oryzae TaxID=1450648 RepID=A0A1V4IJ53_9CLOT|nr:response regulator transcription factor [Clostridium oryzae]OPJ59864.1 transcriptional regulatory protein SrrA [Clostridium oryzae]